MTILLIIEYFIIGALFITSLFSISLLIAKYEVKLNLVFTVICLLLIVVSYGYILRYSASTIEEFVISEKIVQTAVFFQRQYHV